MLFIPEKIRNTFNTDNLTIQEGEKLYTYDEFYIRSKYRAYEILYYSEHLIIVSTQHKTLYDHNFRIIEYIPANIIAAVISDFYVVTFSPSPFDPYNALYELFTSETTVSIKNTNDVTTLAEFRTRHQPLYTPVSISPDEIDVIKNH